MNETVFARLTEHGSKKPFYLKASLVRRVRQGKGHAWISYDGGFWSSGEIAVEETAEEVLARLQGAD